MFIFKRIKTFKNNEMDRFEQEYRIVLKGRLKNMRPTLDFYFKNLNSKGKQPPKLIFVD